MLVVYRRELAVRDAPDVEQWSNHGSVRAREDEGEQGPGSCPCNFSVNLGEFCQNKCRSFNVGGEGALIQGTPGGMYHVARTLMTATGVILRGTEGCGREEECPLWTRRV